MVTSKKWLGVSTEGLGLFGVLWDRTVTGHRYCCTTALWGGLQRAIHGLSLWEGQSQVQVACPVLFRFGDAPA